MQCLSDVMLVSFSYHEEAPISLFAFKQPFSCLIIIVILEEESFISTEGISLSERRTYTSASIQHNQNNETLFFQD